MEAVQDNASYYLSIQNSSVTNVGNLPAETSILRHTLFWTCVLVFAYVAVFVVGVTGNAIVVFVFIKRGIKTATHLFTLNLAIADVSVVIVCGIPTLLSNIFVPWILGSIMCTAVAFVQGVSVCASVYSLVFISVDRFLVIIFPMKWPQGLGMFQARIIVICIWISAFVIISPWLIAFHVVPSGLNNEEFCIETWPKSMDSQLFFLIGNLLMCYGLPLTLISISNCIIWWHVVNRRVPEECASLDSMQRVHRQTRRGVPTMLSIVTLTFLFSWLPLYLIFLRQKIGGPMTSSMENVISITRPFAQWLGASNCCCNPLIYSLKNQKFRDTFKSLITCPKCYGL